MSAVAAAADADDPRQWLERMNQALVSRNYDGTFTYWQRGKVEMRRIIHRVKDGHISERLVSLDGSGREFIRNGGELAIYLPDQRTVIVEKRPEQNPLFGNFPTFDQASTQFYDIKQVKRTRIYRRDARVISVTPRDEFRYGYRLWIDEGTAMPLRTELLDPHGRVIEQLVLAEDKDLRINTNIPDSAFLPEVATEGFTWRRSEPDLGRALANNLRDRWNATSLPPGFRNIMQAAQSMPGTTGRVEHFVFSDGLASVSVFIETQVIAPSPNATDPNAPRAAPPGIAAGAPPGTATAQATASSGNEVAQFGSTSAFSTVVAGRKVTAVGEVPPETVRAIANSLRSIGPAPAFSGAQAPAPAQRQPAPSMSLQGSPRR